jgi:hypothetical protein
MQHVTLLTLDTTSGSSVEESRPSLSFPYANQTREGTSYCVATPVRHSSLTSLTAQLGERTEFERRGSKRRREEHLETARLEAASNASAI